MRSFILALSFGFSLLHPAVAGGPVEKMLGFFDRLRQAGTEQAAHRPVPHVETRFTEDEVNDYMVYALKTTPRPWVKSIHVEFTDGNYMATTVVADLDALERWKPGTIPGALRWALSGTKSLRVDLRFRQTTDKLVGFSAEKAYYQDLRIPALVVEEMMKILAARQAGVPAPLSADQFGFGNPGALLALQLERLHGGLLLEGDGEFAFDALAVDRAGVVGAEGVNLAVGGGIVDHAALHPFHVVVIGIHEVHAGQHEGSVGETLGLIFTAAVALVGHALQGLQELVKVQALGSLLLVEELAQAVPGFELGEKLEAARAGLAGKFVHLAEHGTDLHELGHGDGFTVLIDEQIGSQGAMRVAAQGGGLFAAQGAQQLGEGRHAGERKPVLVGIGDAGLLLDGVGEIGEREALGFEFMPGDAPGEGDRLEADAAGAFDVLQGEADNVADLVIVEAFDDRGDEDDLKAGLLDVLDALQFLLPQGLAAGAAVDIVADAVELQVEGVQAGFLALFGEFQVGEFQAVGG